MSYHQSLHHDADLLDGIVGLMEIFAVIDGALDQRQEALDHL